MFKQVIAFHCGSEPWAARTKVFDTEAEAHDFADAHPEFQYDMFYEVEREEWNRRARTSALPPLLREHQNVVGVDVWGVAAWDVSLYDSRRHDESRHIYCEGEFQLMQAIGKLLNEYTNRSSLMTLDIRKVPRKDLEKTKTPA